MPLEHRQSLQRERLQLHMLHRQTDPHRVHDSPIQVSTSRLPQQTPRQHIVPQFTLELEAKVPHSPDLKTLWHPSVRQCPDYK